MNDRKDHHLCARTDQDVRRVNGRLMLFRKAASYRFAKFANAVNRRVMRLAFLQRLDAGADYGRWRVEVGFSDLEVNNVSSLPLQFRSSGEHLERCFAVDTLHSFRNSVFQFGLQDRS